MLYSAVAQFSGVEASSVRVSARCAHCDRPHGKPTVTAPRMPDGGEIVVSKSRAGEFVAVAVGCGGELGIDLESVSRMTRARVDEVAFAPRERDAIDDAPAAVRQSVRTEIFSLKEAYLKATGEGLRLDLTTVDTTDLARNILVRRVPVSIADLTLNVVLIVGETTMKESLGFDVRLNGAPV